MRWRIFARIRRFLRPTFRRPFPVFFVPTCSSDGFDLIDFGSFEIETISQSLIKKTAKLHELAILLPRKWGQITKCPYRSYGSISANVTFQPLQNRLKTQRLGWYAGVFSAGLCVLRLSMDPQTPAGVECGV